MRQTLHLGAPTGTPEEPNFLLVFIFGITYDLNYLALVGNKHDIFYLWRPILKDPKDDHVLEFADRFPDEIKKGHKT